MATNNNITATVNGITFSGLTIEQAQALAGMAMATVTETAKAVKPSKATPKAKTATAEAKTPKKRREYDAILDSKRVLRMTNTAIKRLETAGFEVKTMNQGTWKWIVPCGKSTGQGRADEFKDVKLPEGWHHSMKRGAFWRDFKDTK